MWLHGTAGDSCNTGRAVRQGSQWPGHEHQSMLSLPPGFHVRITLQEQGAAGGAQVCTALLTASCLVVHVQPVERPPYTTVGLEGAACSATWEHNIPRNRPQSWRGWWQQAGGGLLPQLTGTPMAWSCPTHRGRWCRCRSRSQRRRSWRWGTVPSASARQDQQQSRTLTSLMQPLC